MTDRNEVEALRAEMTQMADELTAMRCELEALRERSAPDEDESRAPSIEIATAVTRRGWMKAAAAAAVGGTAMALGTADRVAAADGQPINIGQTTNEGASRTVATQLASTHTGVSFLFKTETGFSGSTASYPAALAGWTGSTSRPTGIYGYTSVDSSDANGVVGLGQAASAVGVRASNPSVGGTAFVARAAQNGGTGADVLGGYAGLVAEGRQFGVTANGDYAALLLSPTNPAAPPDRSVGQSGGSLEVQLLSDSGAASLWFCTAPGSPGDWRKLAGPFTAGAFHAIEPFRAYDSRNPAPTPGTLATGGTRVVSVKDSRSQSTGAVISPDAVPIRATAVTYNLTVTDTAGTGFLAVAPGSSTSTNVSSINWASAGLKLANAAVVQLDTSRQIKVFCGGAGARTHFIIDITGYYL